jgi:hypothetical protein
VQLLDIVNNGNRVGGKPEALYLFGLGGADGLLIHPGSSLILDDIEVYAWMGGHWVNVDQPYLDSLRPMPLPQITVFIPEPGAVIMLGAAGCWVAGRRGRRRRE